MATKKKKERIASSLGALRDVTKIEERSRSIERRIEKPHGKNGCWFWTGTTSSGGSPQMVRSGKVVPVRRHLYQMAHHLPQGRQLRSECRNKLCVNPNHAYIT